MESRGSVRAVGHPVRRAREFDFYGSTVEATSGNSGNSGSPGPEGRAGFNIQAAEPEMPLLGDDGCGATIRERIGRIGGSDPGFVCVLGSLEFCGRMMTVNRLLFTQRGAFGP